MTEAVTATPQDPRDPLDFQPVTPFQAHQMARLAGLERAIGEVNDKLTKLAAGGRKTQVASEVPDEFTGQTGTPPSNPRGPSDEPCPTCDAHVDGCDHCCGVRMAAREPQCEDLAVRPLRIVNGWLVEETGEHTCGGGGPEASGIHEPGCGLEPLVKLTDLRGFQGLIREHGSGYDETTQRDELARDNAALAEHLHQLGYRKAPAVEPWSAVALLPELAKALNDIAELVGLPREIGDPTAIVAGVRAVLKVQLRAALSRDTGGAR